MALKSVSSEEFSFPALSSQDSPHHPGLDSPPLWKHSPEKSFRQDHGRSFRRLVIDDDNDLTKSFSYVERRSLWSDKETEKMDMLWEDLNEESNTRSQSLRIGEKTTTTTSQSVLSNESSAVAVGCGMKLLKKPKKKKSTNVLMLMRVLKKILALRSSAQRSPAKTHPR